MAIDEEITWWEKNKEQIEAFLKRHPQLEEGTLRKFLQPILKRAESDLFRCYRKPDADEVDFEKVLVEALGRADANSKVQRLVPDSNFKPLRDGQCTLVAVSPCAKEYGGKTFLGIYIGRLAKGFAIIREENDTVLKLRAGHYNPAIFVPELNKIIYGCESFWRRIEGVEEFKEITKEDIDNTWYVALMRNMLENTGTQDLTESSENKA